MFPIGGSKPIIQIVLWSTLVLLAPQNSIFVLISSSLRHKIHMIWNHYRVKFSYARDAISRAGVTWNIPSQRAGRGHRRGMAEVSALEQTDSRRPNLFIIGAMKSSTTYLHGLLNAHPDVFMSDPDEPSYFVDPDELKKLWPEMWRSGIWRSDEAYLQLFQSAGTAAIVGEASTNYTKLPLTTGVAERLHAFAPDARLIYLVRDPVKRSLSHYWHMVRYHAEHRSIAQALRDEVQYVAVSHYSMQLRPFLELFGRGQIAVLTHEQLVRAPAATMRELSGWLGIDPAGFDNATLVPALNVTPEVVSQPTWNGIPRRVRQTLPIDLVVPYMPRWLRASLHRAATREVRRSSVQIADAIMYLQQIQRPQVHDFANLLGRDFPEWTTLYGVPEEQGLIA